MTAFTVWTREGCGLCDELLATLVPEAAARGWRLEVRDVDDDPDALRRYLFEIPVVEADGAPLCRGRLVLAALADYAGRGGGPGRRTVQRPIA